MEFLSASDLIRLAQTDRSARVPCAYTLMDTQASCRLSSLCGYDLTLFPAMGKHVTSLLVSVVELLPLYPQHECKDIVCNVMGVHLNRRLEEHFTRHHGLSPDGWIRAVGGCLRCTEDVNPMVSIKHKDGSHHLLGFIDYSLNTTCHTLCNVICVTLSA